MMSPLEAVSENDLVTLRIICSCSHKNKSKYNLEEMDSYGNTPLLKSCYLNRLECANTLLRFGANVSAINYFGQNALTLATFCGNISLVRLLLQYKTYKDFNESSIVPAICVASLKKNTQLIEFFKSLDPLDNGEDIETVHGLNSSDIKEMLNRRN